jgi:germination protein M
MNTALRIYLLRDGKVAPVRRDIPATEEVATAVVHALAQGATSQERAEGLSTAYPAGAPVTGVTVDNGVATVTLNQTLSHPALAQVVYTLTQFATVQGVRTSRMIGDAPPLTRASFEDVTPSILVESPLPGEIVTSPLRVRGTANTFEATFDLAVLNSSGVRIAWRFVTATSGSGTRGSFDTTVSFARSAGALTLEAYEPSAENGKPTHAVRIPVVQT